MRKSLLFVVVIWLCAVPILAQENTPKAEIFGGYQYSRFDLSGTGVNMNGWNGWNDWNAFNSYAFNPFTLPWYACNGNRLDL